ncbi:MAG: recombinase family protein [Deltaproteobacteria bacterium]|nr:recombinase family protein [Deltaproteobacteria bacterium]
MVDNPLIMDRMISKLYQGGFDMEKRAYGYVRVSGQGQVEGDGFMRQEKAIRDYAEAHGIAVEMIFREEGVSGTLEQRPALARLLLDLEENGHGIKTVIIERIDRLARDLMVQEAIIADLQKKGYELISATEGADLLSEDPTRKLVRQVLGAIAEYDKTMTVLKLRAARERKRAKTGKCEGRKGYSEASPETLKEIRRLRRKPKGMKRRSYEAVAEELNRQGVTTMTGKAWTGANVAMALHRAKKS